MESIEAALSAYHNQPVPAPYPSEQLQMFFSILQSTELKGTLMGLASGLLADCSPEEFDFATVQEQARSGRLNAELMLKVLEVCNEFFGSHGTLAAPKE